MTSPPSNPDTNLTIESIVRDLELAPHPEGGYFRETWRDVASDDGRGHGTSIYFLLPGDVTNRWHRVDAVEIWHHLAGAPLELDLAADRTALETGNTATLRLGKALADGERPQGIVPADHWQRARSLGGWTLVSCTVSPAFEFDRFEMLED